MADETSPSRAIDDIERDLAATRARLADNIACLIDEVHPKAVTRRALADAQTLAARQAEALAGQARRAGGKAWAQTQAAATRLQSFFHDGAGWRVSRLAGAAGGLAFLIALFAVRRGRR
jgi:hypothetical protein